MIKLFKKEGVSHAAGRSSNRRVGGTRADLVEQFGSSWIWKASWRECRRIRSEDIKVVSIDNLSEFGFKERQRNGW